MINVFRKENETKAIKDIILRDIRHFRPKLVHWNEGVCCAPIDRSWKMQFSEGLATLYDQPFLRYEGFCEWNCPEKSLNTHK